MTGSEFNQDGLSFADRLIIDQLCDRFESNLLSGQKPELDDYLGQLPERLMTPGLVELVILDASYSHHSPSPPSDPPRSTQPDDVTDRVASKTGMNEVPSGNGDSLVVWQQYVDRFPSLADVSVPECFQQPGDASQVIDGRFQTRYRHAAGGLGQVSIATDLQINREVAIKEIREKYSSDPNIRRRFLQEAEITGRLEHPGIVPVYAAGHHPNGEPYYAMRLIAGDRMTDAIAQLHLIKDRDFATIARRRLLNRFIDVCNTIDYAHSRQIIHRDIKPHNIMLGEFGETLLVDWGLAKHLADSESAPDSSIGSGSASTPQETRLGTVMGTPGYMSPEQAAGDTRAVDTRSDIYSLGATLHHLLTGKPPAAVNPSEPAAEHDQQIRSALQRSDIRPQLAAVCHCALRFNASERYATAKELAGDIERFLADEPVSVHTDGLLTRCRRHLKKHPALAAASVVTVFLTVIGLIAWSLLTSAHSRDIQSRNQQLDEMVQNEKRLRLLAETSERRTENALTFLTDALQSPDPDINGRDVRVVDVLQDAATRLFEDFPDDPLLQARILKATGDTLFQLGEYESAADLLEQSQQLYLQQVGPLDPRTLSAGKRLGKAWVNLGDQRAIPLLQQVFETSRDTFGKEHELTLELERALIHSQLDTGETVNSIERLEQLIPVYTRVFGPNSLKLESLRGSLALACSRVGNPVKAAEIYRDVYQARLDAHGQKSLASITAGSNYANALMATNKKPDAAELMETLLIDARDHLGDEHYTTIILTRSLGTYYLENGRLNRGIELVEEAVRRTRQRYGEQHRLSLSSANALGIAQIAAGRYDQAAEHLERTWQNFVAVYGPVNAETLTCANNLAMAYRLGGRFEQANRVFRSVLEKQKLHLGEGHPKTILTMVNLGGGLQDVDRDAESIPLLQQAGDLAKEIEPDHKLYQISLSLLSAAHLKLDDNHRALQAITECYKSRQRTMPEHWSTYHAMSVLGEVLMNLDRLDEAQPYLVQSAQMLDELGSKVPQRAKFRIDDAKQRLTRLHELRKQ